MDARFIYITCGSEEEALHIGRKLVKGHLLACANVMSPITAIYRWQDKIEQAQEWVLVGKTTQDKVEDLTEQVVSLHSYDLPCVVALPIEAGSAPFLKWIQDETHPPES